jgi:outer membrane protein assembly factor BamB
MRILLSDVLSVLLVVMSANLTLAESPWSRFHGVGGLGYVAEGEIPSTWTDEDYVWRHELETTDVGSPIVSEGKVYFWASLPTANEITLESLDLATGKRSWSKTFAHPSHHVHNRNTLASSTPVADAKNVFVAYAEPEHTYLKGFDHAGNEIWSRDFGRWQSPHGFGTSPRIFGSMILLFNSQQANRLAPGKIPGQSRVIAVDRATGKTEWETSLSTTRSCYGIPATHVGANGRVQLIGANTGDGIFALDAESGEMLWNLEVFGKRSCSTPLVVGDLAIGSCGSGGGGNELVAVKIPVSANQKAEVAYRIDRAAPYVPTPAVKGGHMFTIADKGIASCLNVKSGEVIWSERIGGNFGASPIIVGDKLLLISLRGEATVLRASEQFEKLGSFDLGGPVGATPAFSDGRLIVRVGNEIRCL